jgi:Asp-tRNA(Asn)/Glu-tRNA(Gln) amidotransferase A subunit family amidase
VPVAVKDNVAVKDEPKREGSAATADAPQQGDAEVVRRLRGAGAVVPVGLHPSGVPMAVQLVGPLGAEGLILQAVS